MLLSAGLAISCLVRAQGPPVDSASVSESVEALPAPAAPPILPRDTEVDKRMFGVIPNHRADLAQDLYTPLTTRQKFAIARSDSFDWPNYFLLAGYAIQNEVEAKGFSHSGGLRTFADYYTRSVGDQIIGCYLTEAILPSMLHEDPRFFRLGSGTLRRRALHVASSVIVTRTDSGGSRLNISELAGNAGVIAITSAYYPESRSASEAGERYAMQLGNDVISNFLTEFWPDIKRHLPLLHHSPRN